MNTRLNIREMTDRELRAYKRSLRRRREIRRRCMLFLMTFCLIMVCAVSYCSVKSNADTGNDLSFKYYTGIIVAYGDTLWDIAEQYIDYDQYSDKNAYIEEVKSINHLNAEADIKAGQHLVVPYFSSDFVK